MQTRMPQASTEKRRVRRPEVGDHVVYLQHTFPFPRDLYGCKGQLLSIDSEELAYVLFTGDRVGTLVELIALELSR